MYIHMCISKYIYIYICIERERKMDALLRYSPGKHVHLFVADSDDHLEHRPEWCFQHLTLWEEPFVFTSIPFYAHTSQGKNLLYGDYIKRECLGSLLMGY